MITTNIFITEEICTIVYQNIWFLISTFNEYVKNVIIFENLHCKKPKQYFKGSELHTKIIP